MANEVLLKDCVLIDMDVNPAKKDVALAQIAKQLGSVLNVDAGQIESGLLAREEEGTTGFTDGIAIPHTQVPDLDDARIGVVTFANPVAWESLDGKDIEIATVLLTPNGNGNQDHLKLLSMLSRKLMNEEFVSELHENKHDQNALFNMIAEIVNK
ncbi:PTS fructose transporter subunit IIA [Companilactobacillus sp. RD055328]|uniref:PTS sugar transporter subunit IIA n=1 Tax=Companilactobacillus sp. RD055328 TaxID=2916634 RepID=UPI001FC82AF7|nr:PTS sugar transporter subunit IIA [Companilactobacillus sp. RD055328]GKQ42142.1 PTS fructose transporter subunit IIA [Companilactobacillus sp. RD055328]